MRFSITREALLRPLQLTSGVVDRKQTLAILGNVLIRAYDDKLAVTASDLEVEMIVYSSLNESQAGEVTVPAKKFTDIVRALPDEAVIDFTMDNERAIVRSGRSRFVLSTLPAGDFPSVDSIAGAMEFSVPQNAFKRLLERTHFAMAQQDVRYYLNGLLLEVGTGELRTVATDGHRLSLCECRDAIEIEENQQVILPRKGVLELIRLLEDNDETLSILLGPSHVRVSTQEVSFTSKLIDGRFPDYQRVVPEGGDKIVVGDKEVLRQALLRASILSNERYRSVRFQLAPGSLRVLANNPEQEEAEEEVAVDYNGDRLEIGFNANYMLDAITAVNESQIKLTLTDANSCCLVEGIGDNEAKYVVMPMRI